MQKANLILRSIFLLFIFPSQVFLGVNPGTATSPLDFRLDVGY